MNTMLDVLAKQSRAMQELARSFDREYGPSIRAVQEQARQFDREYGPSIRAMQKRFDREYGPSIRAMQELARSFDREYGPSIRAVQEQVRQFDRGDFGPSIRSAVGWCMERASLGGSRAIGARRRHHCGRT